MKKIYSIFATLLLSLAIFSCQSEEKEVLEDNAGYLRLELEAVQVTQTTKIIDNYNPKQLAVTIKNSLGTVVQSTDNHEDWSDLQMRLAPGKYTIEAKSYGFDGTESGFDIPYYTGSTTVTVSSGKETTASITCKLANVKVTVNYDKTFVDAFASAYAEVSSAVENVLPQTFTMGTTTTSAYFPAGALTSKINVVNKAGVANSSSYLVTDVRPRDHIIFNYKAAKTGTAGGVKVEVDASEKGYTFIFNVSTESKTTLQMKNVNAWSKFAYVEGYVAALEAGKTIDPAYMGFEYKLASAEDWTSATSTVSGENYKATLKSLAPNSTYECRLVYNNGSESYASTATTFTTEAATVLYNGNFDNWYKKDKCWYADTQAGLNNGGFWDSSNPGSATFEINVTTGDASTVHTAGGQAARLESKYIVIKFAAASLYTGSFVDLVGTSGAKIDFGRPFTSRPTQLKGWFNYTPSDINRRGNDTPEGVGIKGTPDLCSIYCALTTEVISVDNTNMSTFPDWNNDPRVIAYGALSDAEAVNTGGWKEFNIDLTYSNLTEKPKYIVLVCSSSKYGDYFTGGDNSLLYLDDFELMYDAEPTTK